MSDPNGNRPDSPFCHTVQATDRSLYVDETVCAMVERQTDLTPHGVALICEGRQLTYRELDQQVSRLAWHLRTQHTLRPESVVGLLLGPSHRMLISMLAVLKAGGAYVPISPQYPASRVSYILDDVDPRLLITERQHAPLANVFDGPQLCWDETPLAWAQAPYARLAEVPDVRRLVYIMYTSGSTGNPKGVMVEHRNLSNFIQWCREEYRDSAFDVVYAATPYGFDLSNIELFFPLTVGRPIRLLPSSHAIGIYLRRDRNVMINTVPSLVQELLKTDGILRNVSVLNLGGETVQPSLLRALRAYPQLEIRNMYGPTETTSTAINHRMDANATEIVIGTPIANTVTYILDRNLRPVAVDERGEICIGGRGLTRGYWRRPELTRERFVGDPFRPGELLYRTGDIGMYLRDGNIRCFGRNDNQVKLRGFRVELDEIGSQLSAHVGVAEAIVGVRQTHTADRLVAVVRPAKEGVRATELLAFLHGQLPAYMVPDEVEFVDRIPLTHTGKVDREVLFGRRTA